MEKLVQQRDELLKFLINSSQSKHLKQCLIQELKIIEKDLKNYGYTGTYLTQNKRHESRQQGGATKNSQVQSIMFEKHIWSVPKAAEWLDKHGFSYEEVDITGKYFKFQQFPPRKVMRTITFSEDDGIKAVISFSNKKSSTRKRSPRKRSPKKSRKRKSPSKKK